MPNEKVLKRVLSGDRTNTKTKRKGIEVMWEEMKGWLYRSKLKLKTVVIGFIYSKPVGLG